MEIQEIHKHALQTLRIAQERYSGVNEQFLPLILIKEWVSLTEQNEVDLDEVAKILRQTEELINKNDHDLFFFLFYNSLKKHYHDLWDSFLIKKLKSIDLSSDD